MAIWDRRLSFAMPLFSLLAATALDYVRPPVDSIQRGGEVHVFI
jgi:hypothetical protein